MKSPFLELYLTWGETVIIEQALKAYEEYLHSVARAARREPRTQRLEATEDWLRCRNLRECMLEDMR